MICAYPGYTKPVIAFCQGTELWKYAGLKEGDSVTVTLKEKGRYRETQDILNIRSFLQPITHLTKCTRMRATDTDMKRESIN